MTQRIAAYVDQVSDDPLKAIDVCKSLGIRYLAVSKLWSTDILSCNDDALAAFKKRCQAAGLDVIALEADQHSPRMSVLASYFKVNQVVYRQPISSDVVMESVHHDFMPLVYYQKGFEKSSSRVKYYYDPSLVGKNHFGSVWSGVKDQVSSVSVNDRDARIGARPFGSGENQFKAWLPDARDKWHFLKPNLGRRIGSLDSREAVFKANFEAYKTLLGV
jgi:hypothetical protein